MPMGKKGYASGGMMKGMKDGSRMATPMQNMNGRIDPGMTNPMRQTKTAMSKPPTMGQTMGSMGDAARGNKMRKGGY